MSLVGLNNPNYKGRSIDKFNHEHAFIDKSELCILCYPNHSSDYRWFHSASRGGKTLHMMNAFFGNGPRRRPESYIDVKFKVKT